MYNAPDTILMPRRISLTTHLFIRRALNKHRYHRSKCLKAPISRICFSLFSCSSSCNLSTYTRYNVFSARVNTASASSLDQQNRNLKYKTRSLFSSFSPSFCRDRPSMQAKRSVVDFDAKTMLLFYSYARTLALLQETATRKQRKDELDCKRQRERSRGLRTFPSPSLFALFISSLRPRPVQELLDQ